MLGVVEANAQLFIQNNADVGSYDLNTGAFNGNVITGNEYFDRIATYNGNIYTTSDHNPAIGPGTDDGSIELNGSSPPLATGLGNTPTGMAISNNTLYVVSGNFSNDTDTVEEYNATTGATINSALISNLGPSLALALSGNNLYVFTNNPSSGSYGIGEYNATTGAVINSSFITGLTYLQAIAVSGNTLYAPTSTTTIGAFNATTGAIINQNFITGVYSPDSLAIGGNNLLYVDNAAIAGNPHAYIGVYNLSGGTVNADLTGPVDVFSIAVIATPEPSTNFLFLLGFGLIIAWRSKGRIRKSILRP